MLINFDEFFLLSCLDLRPSRASDDIFLERVFGSSREDLLQLNLPGNMLELMLRQQYRLQQEAYRQRWPDARIWIVQAMGLPVGKIMLAQHEQSVHIVDMAFLPEERGKGRGRALLTILQVAVAQHQSVLSLAVDKYNWRARKLYDAMGFVMSASTATHDFMQWQSATNMAGVIGEANISDDV